MGDPTACAHLGKGDAGTSDAEGCALGPWTTLRLSTVAIRLNGGELVESGKKEGYLGFREDGPTMPRTENRGSLTLSASLRGSGNHAASVHASFANEKQSPTMKRRHDTLGHIDPAAMKHLEKGGLIDVKDNTVTSDTWCSACRECQP